MFYHLIARDIIEIVFYSSCIFTLCQWLRTDKTKNITIYFFAYCALALSAWVAQMPTLTPFLFTYAPIALLLFIVLHEKTLQRNLVALCSITPARIEHTDWLDTLLSSSLATINANKAITVIIEHKDALDHFVTTPFSINADLTKNVLDIFLMSSSYDEHKMIWVNTSGKIRGINVTWNNIQETCDDHIIFTAHPASRTFSVIINGKETKNLSAHHVHTMIKKQLSSLSSSQRPKGAYREYTKSEKTISQ
jgi:hypothetical protein